MAANTSASSRTGYLTVAGKTFTVTQAGTACSYSISLTSASYAAGGGSGSVTVTGTAGCVWSATSGAAWITITAGNAGTGNGAVSYSVAANTSASSRSGTMTIAGQNFTINQAGSAVSAGQLQWVRTSLAPYMARVNGVATDRLGNVIAVGSLYNYVDFGSGLVTSAGGYDGFIAKYTSGGALLWVKRLGGSGYDNAYGVAVDSQNNIIVAGVFQGSVDFGGSTISAAGGSLDQDGFAAKYSPGSAGVPGTLIWAKNFGGIANDFATGVGVDGGDNVVVISKTGGTVYFGNGITLNGHGGWDVALVKFAAATGATAWAQLYGGSYNDNANGVAVDRNGDVLVTGSFGGSGNLGGVPLAGSAASGIFVAKYSGLNGAYAWSRVLAGSAGYGIAVDMSTGNVFVTGQGGAGFFVNGYDASGNALWAKTYGNSGDVGYAIAADGGGNVALTGICGSVDWQGNYMYSNGSGYFVASLTTSGVFRWKLQSNDYACYGYGISFDSLNHVVTGGTFQFTADFGGISATSGSGVYNAFVAQYLQMSQ